MKQNPTRPTPLQALVRVVVFFEPRDVPGCLVRKGQEPSRAVVSFRAGLSCLVKMDQNPTPLQALVRVVACFSRVEGRAPEMLGGASS